MTLVSRILKFTASLLFALLFCVLPASSQIRSWKAVAVKTYPHDTRAYTQGLFFHEGCLYESTGEYGRSSLRKVDLKSGKVLQESRLERKYFGEGSCVVDNKIYMLSWQNRLAFVYDARTLVRERMLSYPREGWGLVTIPEAERHFYAGAVMVASDGSSNLYFLDRSLRTLFSVKVTIGGRELRLLNELEWIDGRIWANVYTTDLIVVIDPRSGRVTDKVDCSGLIPASKRTPDMDVLNGIAVLDGKIHLTGKDWPSLFEIVLEKQ